MSEFDFSWVTEPPIRVYTGRQAVRVKSSYTLLLSQYIADYKVGLSDPQVMHALSSANIKNAEEMCGIIRNAELGENDVFLIYKAGRNIVAMMILQLFKKKGYVRDVVVHPAAEFGGNIMIEFAINYCVEQSREPILELWALNTAAVGPYKGMGFESGGEEQDLRLDLTKPNPKWAKLEGKWRYKSSRDPGPMYASATRVEA